MGASAFLLLTRRRPHMDLLAPTRPGSPPGLVPLLPWWSPRGPEGSPGLIGGLFLHAQADACPASDWH